MPRARADRAHHLQIERGAHLEPLSLEQLVLASQAPQAAHPVRCSIVEMALLIRCCSPHSATRGRCGHLLALSTTSPVRGCSVYSASISSPNISMRMRKFLVHRDDLDGVAAHAERAAREREVVARVLHLHEFA